MNQTLSTSHQPQYWPDNALPKPWVERIFDRMSVLYGSKFADLWRGVEPEGLKQAWAEELCGFKDQPERIKQALDALRGLEQPPTLPQFINMLRNTHSTAPIALPAPVDREAGAKKLEEVVKPAIKTAQDKTDHLSWAKVKNLSQSAERNLLDLVERRDARFFPIFREHRKEGRLKSERANAIEVGMRAA